MVQHAADEDHWNVLARAWLDVSSHSGAWRRTSPMSALAEAAEIRILAASSPLDEFAAHRFLTTLLYWKSDAAGGIAMVRDQLLAGRMPPAVLEAIAAEQHCFSLFDPEWPFLQDPNVEGRADKPVGSLFAEIATGTNIAHFDHSRDLASPLCVPCVVRGMLRLVPWSQSGGAGLTPSIHGAPPIACMPRGASLAETLGLMLVDVSGPFGTPTWSGTFSPTTLAGPIPLLEALTWNPRRVLLPRPSANGQCGLCGDHAPCISSIVFKKNEAVKKPDQADGKRKSFDWHDPVFLYDTRSGEPRRSGSEEQASKSEDLAQLSSAPSLAAVAPEHRRRWSLAIPCTNPANNKTFDHRRVDVGALADLASMKLEHRGADGLGLERHGLAHEAVGWPSRRASPGLREVIARFIGSSNDGLTEDEWLSLRDALGRPMHEAPAAFAAYSAVLWRVRAGGRSVFRRDAAWSLVKLMSIAPSTLRSTHGSGSLEPLLDALPVRQGQRLRSDALQPGPYPVSPPSGIELELALAAAVDAEIARGHAVPWIDLGAFLHASSR